MPDLSKQRSIKFNSYIIAACILASRVLGLVREIILARLLGTTVYSDALKAAIRIPNIIQNLLGEGVLSASLIPVYARLKSEGRGEEAARAAKEVGIVLFYTALLLAIVGASLSPYFANLFAGGFSAEGKQLTAELMVFMFPATCLLVLSAWCLGILNSHRHFLLSYSAPILWNLTIIAGLLMFATNLKLHEITILAASLFLIGSFFQFFVQFPKTLSLIKKAKVSFFLTKISAPSKEIGRNFPPVVLGKGVIQISSYLDTIIASFLAPGSLSALMYAQIIYITPISVFGLSNAAASLPELSEQNPMNASDVSKSKIKLELTNTLERVLLYCLPTILVLWFLGSEIISLILESGKFNHQSTLIVYYTLTTFLFGLVPSIWSRIITSLLYAANAQKAVSKIAIFRLLCSSILSVTFCFYLFPQLNYANEFLVGGIGFASSITSYFELALLNYSARKTTNINPLKEVFRPKNNSIKLLVFFLSLFALLEYIL